MRKFTLTIVLSLIIAMTHAQNPSWIWAKQAGSIYYELAVDISSDKNNHMLVTGTFSSPSVTIGSTPLTNNSISNYSDFYIAKYDTAGNVIWVRSYGGLLSEDATGVTSDLSGNIYVTGAFNSDTLIIGNDTLYCTDPWGDSSDVFIAKFDPLGNPLWARACTGMGHEYVTSIETDPAGDVYITGDFDSDTVNFGALNLVNNAMGNSFDTYVVKYNSAGNEVWARKLGGTDYEFSKGLTVDGNGNVIITGYSRSDSIFTPVGALANSSMSAYHDFFVVKYSINGTMIWARMAGGPSDDNANDVDSDANGNVFVTGNSYSLNFTFGTDSFVNYSGFGTDIFLVKYDANGNPQWAESAGGLLDDNPFSVHCDNQNKIYVGGSYASSVAYFGNDSLTNANGGNGDIFIAEYDQSGNVVNVIKAAGTQGDGLYDISSDGYGGIYAVGAYNSNPCVFGTITLPFSGFYDMYVAKYSDGITGIVNHELSIDPAVYPNPFAEYITISLGENVTGTAEIYSADGKIVSATTLISGDNLVLTGTLSSGIYIVRVVFNDTVSQMKLVKLETN
jgi:hypothetical protein